MKKLNNDSIQEFNIKGFLIGFCFGIVGGIITFIFTKEFTISVAVLTALGVTIGVSFEQKIKAKDKWLKNSKKILGILFGLGVFLFISLLIFYLFGK